MTKGMTVGLPLEEAGNERDGRNLLLVNELDEVVGYGEKLEVHQNGGKLHRAFSIFLFNARGEMLLQRRAPAKYHFAGLWSNACCGHPLRGQELHEAAFRRLGFEFGFETPLEHVGSFLYRAFDAKSGLIEHEFDHIFRGQWDGQPAPNPEEISDWKWMEVEVLREDVAQHPELYTPWFQIVLEEVLGREEHRPAPVVQSPIVTSTSAHTSA